GGDSGSNATASNVAELLQEASSHGLPAPVDAVAAAARGGGGVTVTAEGLAGGEEGVDESWEIVNAPGLLEVDAAAPVDADNASGGAGVSDGVCVVGADGSQSGPESQSDSYSEYLAAMDAERLDRQLAAEAEEEEAKLDAEALMLSRGAGAGVDSAVTGGRNGTGRPPAAATAAVTDATGGDGGGGGKR
ncbi:unnamed protein product, partial [Scytosiphon promiscuus]